MAVPAAPANVFVQSGDQYTYLSWDILSGATSYKIQRAFNGVDYSDLGTSNFNNFTDNSIGSNITIASGNLAATYKYQITVLGTSTAADWLAIGVPASVAPAVGVVFTATATGAGAGTGAVQNYGNQYYYRVAGVNISGTGAYTNMDPTGAMLLVSPAPSGLTTLAALRLNAQEEADLVNSQFLTLPEWNRLLTLAYKELYDLLIAAYGNDYYIKTPFTYTTTGTVDPNYNAQVYPLPQDFYKLILCDVALNPGDPNSWVTLKQYERIQQNLWNFPNVYTFYGITNLRYRLTGTQLQIVPIASANQTIRIWYAPRPAKLVADTDVIDGISGWERYIIVDAAMKALNKQEQTDITELMNEKMALKSRLEIMANNRNIAEPQKVSDSRMRNFAWGSEGDFGGGGMW